MVMLDYYPLQATINTLSTDKHTYSAADIATLCRAGKLTPVFGYSGFATLPIGHAPSHEDPDGLSYYIDEHQITPFNGYLTHHKLLNLLDGHLNNITLDTAINEPDSVLLLAEDTTTPYRLEYRPTPIILTKEQLLFSSKEVAALAEQTQTSQLTQAHDHIAELEQQLKEATLTQLRAPVTASYTTPAMDVMTAVINKFWLDYDPGQPAPKQDTITAWITQNYSEVSNALALNIDKVCRHSSAKSGGLFKR